MLREKNIFTVPSIHFSPQFAAAVRKMFFKLKPDVIAVELPSNCKDKILEAVKMLPALTVVYTHDRHSDKYPEKYPEKHPDKYSEKHSEKHPEQDSIFSFIPVIPTDSIIEGVRLGLEYNVPVEFIDLNIKIVIPEMKGMLLDEVSIETVGLENYYREAEAAFDNGEIGAGNSEREELMAWHLNLLSAEYKKVLFICGMAHWARIKIRLGETNNFHQHRIRKQYEIAEPDLPLLEYGLGIFPYHLYMYEKSRSDNSYNWLHVLHSLYSDSRNKDNVTLNDMKNMIKYARNKALLSGRIEPDLFRIVMSAKQMIDDGYAFNVLRRARFYPGHGKSQLPKMKYDPDTCLADVRGVRKKLVLRVPNYSGQERIGFIDSIEFKPKKREPLSEYKGEKYINTDNWGRYNDEMKRETEFFYYLEKKWNEIHSRDEDFESYLFTGGLMDGIDYRSMIKDLIEKRIYVKEDTDVYSEFHLILFEYISMAEEKELSNEYDYIYQFGKTPGRFHVGFGITARQINNRNGTGTNRWYSLASFKKQKDVDYAIASIDKVIDAYSFGYYESIIDTMRHISVEQSPGKNILIIGIDGFSEELKRHAAAKKRKLHFWPKQSINEELIRENSEFNVYYKY